MADDEEEDLAALRNAVLASMKTKAPPVPLSKKTEEDCDLEALRLAALKTKKQPSGEKPIHVSPVQLEVPLKETVHNIGPRNSPLRELTVPRQGSPHRQPYRAQRNFTKGSGRPQFPGQNRPSNLIVIQTTEPANVVKTSLVMPQDKWASSFRLEKTVSKPEKPKVPARFSRFESDSSDEESDRDSDSESTKSDSSSSISSAEESGNNSDENEDKTENTSTNLEDKDVEKTSSDLPSPTSPSPGENPTPTEPVSVNNEAETSQVEMEKADVGTEAVETVSVTAMAKPDYTRVPPPACTPPRPASPEHSVPCQPSQPQRVPPQEKSTGKVSSGCNETVPQLKSTNTVSDTSPKPTDSKPMDLLSRSTVKLESKSTKCDVQPKLSIKDRLGKRVDSKLESSANSEKAAVESSRLAATDKGSEVDTGKSGTKIETQKPSESESDNVKPISTPAASGGTQIQSIKVNGTSQSSDSSSSSSNSSDSESESDSSSSLSFSNSDSESDSEQRRDKYSVGQERARDDIERERRRRVLKEGEERHKASRQLHDVRRGQRTDSRDPHRSRDGAYSDRRQGSDWRRNERLGDARRHQPNQGRSRDSGRLRDSGPEGRNHQGPGPPTSRERGGARSVGNLSRSKQVQEESRSSRSQENIMRKAKNNQEVKTSKGQTDSVEAVPKELTARSSNSKRAEYYASSREQLDPKEKGDSLSKEKIEKNRSKQQVGHRSSSREKTDQRGNTRERVEEHGSTRENVAPSRSRSSRDQQSSSRATKEQRSRSRETIDDRVGSKEKGEQHRSQEVGGHSREAASSRGSSREQTDYSSSRIHRKEPQSSTDTDSEENTSKKRVKSITSVVKLQEGVSSTSRRRPESSSSHLPQSKSHSGEERQNRATHTRSKSRHQDGPGSLTSRVVIKNTATDSQDAREVIAQLKRKHKKEGESQGEEDSGKMDEDEKRSHSPTINITFNEDPLMDQSKMKSRVSVHQRLGMPVKRSSSERLKRDQVQVHRRVIAGTSPEPHLSDSEQKPRKSVTKRLGIWSPHKDATADVQEKLNKKDRGTAKRLAVWSSREMLGDGSDHDDGETLDKSPGKSVKSNIEKRLGVCSKSPPEVGRETVKERLGEVRSKGLEKRRNVWSNRSQPREAAAGDCEAEKKGESTSGKSLERRFGVWSSRTPIEVSRSERGSSGASEKDLDRKVSSNPRKRERSEIQGEGDGPSKGSKMRKTLGGADEDELNARIRRIQEQNAAIMKRKEEVERDKQRYKQRYGLQN